MAPANLKVYLPKVPWIIIMQDIAQRQEWKKQLHQL